MLSLLERLYNNRLVAFIASRLFGRTVGKRLAATRRMHRRMEAMLMHPLRDKVMSVDQARKIEDARDVLRKQLELTPLHAEALGKLSLDGGEIAVIDDGSGRLVFGSTSAFDRDLFEKALYGRNLKLDP